MQELTSKSHRFANAVEATLCLPLQSADPIVEAYRAGESPNDYMLRLMLATTREGDRVLDLGCHVGTFAVGAAALNRIVIAVDALPSHVSILKASAAANRFDHLEVHWRAIDQKRKAVEVHEWALWTSVVKSNKAGAIRVPACTLDEIAAETSPGKVAFIKMDIEGSELGAIRSGQRLLRESGPVVLFESNGMTSQLAGNSVKAIRREFERAGYKVFRVEGDRWIYAPVGEIQPEGWVDMLALNEDHQRKWADRISWSWGFDALFERASEWAKLPHDSVRAYVVDELRSFNFPPAERERFTALAQTIEATLPGRRLGIRRRVARFARYHGLF